MSQAFQRLSAKTKRPTPRTEAGTLETSSRPCLLWLDLLLSCRGAQVGGWPHGLSSPPFSLSAKTL